MIPAEMGPILCVRGGTIQPAAGFCRCRVLLVEESADDQKDRGLQRPCRSQSSSLRFQSVVWTGKNCYDRSVRSRAHSKLHLARDGGKTPLPLKFRSCGKHCNHHWADRGIPKRSQVQRGGCVVRTHALLLLLSALAVPVNMTCRKAPHAVTHACPCA